MDEWDVERNTKYEIEDEIFFILSFGNKRFYSSFFSCRGLIKWNVLYVLLFCGLKCSVEIFYEWRARTWVGCELIYTGFEKI